MQFRIADTFTDSLVRLTGEEQKLVKMTVFDLQVNPANPGLKLHKLDKVRDKNFWSVRVGSDVRVIVHRTEGSFLLCYVGHHDEAYQWTERRKLETHPQTGAAQFVEIRETVKEIVRPVYVDEKEKKSQRLLFADISDVDLFKYGVPGEWLDDVRGATEGNVLDLVGHLPAEAAEALLVLATGGIPQVREYQSGPQDMGFDHPDAQRRFRVMNNIAELEQALEYPWDKWTIFLHPAQKQLVEKDYDGPVRVSGSAGTGKTVVAVHRAVFLLRNNPSARVLLATFSEPLAHALHNQIRRMVNREPSLLERLEVKALDGLGERLYELHFGKPSIASVKDIRKVLTAAAKTIPDLKFSLNFLQAEWEDVVDAWQLETWEAYRDVIRLGRKTRLSETQRVKLWSIFSQVRDNLAAKKLITRSGMFGKLTRELAGRTNPPFDFIVVDEAQDINVGQLRFLAAIGMGRKNGLFFTGDLGQRVFQQPFSWKALGVDIRGRSQHLTVNYRTSHQIRMQADRLLNQEISDVDGNVDVRTHTVSVFNGPKPQVWELLSQQEEIDQVNSWLLELRDKGLSPQEIAIFVRSESELARAQAAVQQSGIPYTLLDEHVQTVTGHISISTMHLAKGLEFRAVAVMACDDQVIPSQKRIESEADSADLEEVYNTERHLLYVACTRARDNLLVTGVKPASEFLDDLKM